MKVQSEKTIEQAVISAILRNGYLIDMSISRGITEDSFTDESCKLVYKTMLEMVKAGSAVDMIAVNAAMHGNEELLMDLHGKISTDVHFPDWLETLVKMEAARKVQIAAANFAAKAEVASVAECMKGISELEVLVGKSRNMVNSIKIPTLEECAASYMAKGRDKEKLLVPYYPAGTEGAFILKQARREIHCHAAPSGMGKTAHACGWVYQMIKAGLRVLYICNETESDEILARIAAQVFGVSHFIVKSENPNHQAMLRYVAGMKEIVSMQDRLFIRGSDTGVNTPSSIRHTVRSIIAECGRLDAMVIDFIQNMRVPNYLQKERRVTQLEYCADELHDITMKNNLHTIILSQINRDVLKQGIKPRQEHLKDCSKIAELSHTISFLHYDRNKPKEPAMFYSDKTRNQEPFLMMLDWGGAGYVSREKFTAETGKSAAYKD